MLLICMRSLQKVVYPRDSSEPSSEELYEPPSEQPKSTVNLLMAKIAIVITMSLLFIVLMQAFYTAIVYDLARINANILFLAEELHNDIEVRRLKSRLANMRTMEDYKFIRDRIKKLKNPENSNVEEEYKIIEHNDEGG